MHLAEHIEQARQSERVLAQALGLLAERHNGEAVIVDMATRLGSSTKARASTLWPFIERYGTHCNQAPRHFFEALFRALPGPALVRDLRDTALLAMQARLSWTILSQAAQVSGDQALVEICERALGGVDGVWEWCNTRIKAVSPQALLVPGSPAGISEIPARVETTPRSRPWGPWLLVAVAALALPVLGRVALSQR